MRDRLIERLDELLDLGYSSPYVADHILADGWIRLPCRVGTDLYLSDYPNMHCRLKEYKFCGDKIAIVIDCWEWQRTCTRWLDAFGETVFLTKEAALKGGIPND